MPEPFSGAFVHYSGHRADAPARQPPRLNGAILEEASDWLSGQMAVLQPQGGYGALASGADILFAEALLAAGAELHVVLPLPPEDFQRLSVDGAAEDWRPRFQRCWEQSTSQRVLGETEIKDTDLAIAFASQVAMGLALLAADQAGVAALQLLVWDGKVGQGHAGTAADAATWQVSGQPQRAFSLTPPHLPHPQPLPLVYCVTGGVTGRERRFSDNLDDALRLARFDEDGPTLVDVALNADALSNARPNSLGLYASERFAALARLWRSKALALLPASDQPYRIEFI